MKHKENFQRITDVSTASACLRGKIVDCGNHRAYAPQFLLFFAWFFHIGHMVTDDLSVFDIWISMSIIFYMYIVQIINTEKHRTAMCSFTWGTGKSKIICCQGATVTPWLPTQTASAPTGKFARWAWWSSWRTCWWWSTQLPSCRIAFVDLAFLQDVNVTLILIFLVSCNRDVF